MSNKKEWMLERLNRLVKTCKSTEPDSPDESWLFTPHVIDAHEMYTKVNDLYDSLNHEEKVKLFSLLDAEEIGMKLTENYAMTPAASVSGLYFSNKNSKYFTVGKINESQVLNYASKRNETINKIKILLGSNLT